MKVRYSKLVAALAVSATIFAVAGCGQSGQQNTDILVNSYKLTTSDSQNNSTFTGTVVAQNKTAVHARVSGHVIEKYVKGGDHVEAGQALYKLDSRQYEADLASAQATAARSNAAYQNSQRDLQRYQTLASEDAIAQQTVDTQAATSEQNLAALKANEAAIQIAEDNLADTVVYAPFSGTLEMDDIDLGTFVTAGTTTLVTLDSTDPVFVQFTLTEQEYLDFMKDAKNGATEGLQLKLADGSTYAYTGTVTQSAKTLDPSTGKLIIKASFPNPDGLLIPNMFATIVAPGAVVKDSILVPSKAIVQILDKHFIYVIDKDGKVTQTPVEVGATQGAFTIITSGLKTGDEIVVDGLTKVKNGVVVKAKALSKSELEKAAK